jgi:hypothetical protein
MDFPTKVEERDKFFQAQLVKTQIVNEKRNELKWCYRREGVNHMENCAELAKEYIQLIKSQGGWFKAYKQPSV